MTKEKGSAESYAEDIAAIAASFEQNESAGKDSLTQLLVSDPPAFCAAGIGVLGRMKLSAGTRHVAQLLAENKHSSAALLDPSICSVAEAVTAAKALPQNGKKLETAFEMALSKALHAQSCSNQSTYILRILNLLEAIAAQGWWTSFQVELMAYPDKLVRSKAALLIGRSLKNAAWIGRRWMDRDHRVQANAVEALWELDAAESKALLLIAMKSKNNRVAGNAAWGLYRLADIQVVRALLDMARHEELSFRLSALWAIGETQDPRFLPFLAEQFKTAEGKSRLAVTKALARIRRREKAVAELGTLEIHVPHAALQPGGRRRLTFAVSKPGTGDLTKLKATDVALWEAGILVEDYELKSSSNPALLVTGFVAPQFLSSDDPGGDAVLKGLERCAAWKRSDDLMRIDRYTLAPDASAPPASRQQSAMPYDEALVTEELKSRYGFIAASDQLKKVLSAPVPPERAAPNLVSATLRLGRAASKHGGKRQIIVLPDPASADLLRDEAALSGVKQLIHDGSVVMHGLCMDASDSWPAFRGLCLSTPEGTFDQTSIDEFPAKLEEIYLQQLNRYEINYSAESRERPGAVNLKVCSAYGAGQAEFTF